jgi:hypothetical protein
MTTSIIINNFLTDKKCSENNGAIQIVAPVIANPQGEAIHTGTPDCFASYFATPRKDGDGRNDDEKQCTKPPRAKYKQIASGFAFAG